MNNGRKQTSTFARLWAIVSLLLFAATWRLWFPDLSNYPAIPLIDGWRTLPTVLLPVSSFVVLVGLTFGAIGNARWCWWLVAVSLAVSFLLDQHRLQPWAYQLSIYALMFATFGERQLHRWLIPMAASVYIYSAVGKFDFQFAHTVGQEFLQTASRLFGGLPAGLDETVRAKLVLMLPAAELTVGVGLLFRRTRRVAGVVLIGMHVSLIAMLGPWGLGHSLGVLVWNVGLIFQAYWLAVRREAETVSEFETIEYRRFGSTATLVRFIVVFALLAPLGERWGYWDHWLSWSLYSPHTSRVDVQVHRSAISTLSANAVPFVEADSDNDGWHNFSMPAWSLESRRVPIYPQSRYQMRLAIAFAEKENFDQDVRAVMRSLSDRWTGQRGETLMLGLAAIKDAAPK